MADLKDAAVQEALLDAYLDDVKAGAASGEAVIAAVKHDEAELTTFVTRREDADKVTVYNQYDGVPSRVNVSMLSKQLRKRFPKVTDIPAKFWGKRAFGMTPPADAPVTFKFTCWFHPDNEKYAELQRMGLTSQVCSKANIPTLMDVELHVQRKHPMRFKVIVANEAKERETRDRDRADKQLEAMLALAGKAAAPAAEAATPAPAKATTKE